MAQPSPPARIDTRTILFIGAPCPPNGHRWIFFDSIPISMCTTNEWMAERKRGSATRPRNGFMLRRRTATRDETRRWLRTAVGTRMGGRPSSCEETEDAMLSAVGPLLIVLKNARMRQVGQRIVSQQARQAAWLNDWAKHEEDHPRRSKPRKVNDAKLGCENICRNEVT